MARHFNGTSQWYYTLANEVPLAPTAQHPFSLMAWFNPEATVQDGTLVCLAPALGSVSDTCRLVFNATGFEISATARAGAGTENFATTSGAGTAGQAAGVWGCAVGTWFSATDRRAFYGRPGIAAIKATSSTSIAWGAPAVICAGARSNGSAWHKGHIAHVAMWDVALTDAEAGALTQGASPLSIRPDRLVFYYPLENGNGGLVRPADASGRGRIALLPTSATTPTTPTTGPTAQLVNDPPLSSFLPPWQSQLYELTREKQGAVSSTPVSTTIVAPLDAAGGIAATDVQALDAVQALAASGASVLDAAQALSTSGAVILDAPQGITATGADPLDAPGGIAATAVTPLEVTQGLASTVAEIIDALQGISATGLAPIEAPGGVSATDALVLDALQGIASAPSDPIEAAGSANTPVSQTAVFFIESTQDLAATAATALDTVQPVTVTGQAPVEANQQVAAAAVDAVEALAGIAQSFGLVAEAPAGVAQTGASTLDTVSPVAAAAAQVVEALQAGITKTVVAPVESMKGVSFAVVFPLDSLGSTGVIRVLLLGKIGGTWRAFTSDARWHLDGSGGRWESGDVDQPGWGSGTEGGGDWATGRPRL